MIIYLIFILCSVAMSSSGFRIDKKPLKRASSVTATADIPRKSSTAFQKANDVAMRHGMYGAIAGSVQVVSLMWLRTIVNYQYRYGVSTSEAIRALYKEGGVGRFYRGMPLALIQNPLMKFGAVAANEGSKVLVAHFGGSDFQSPLLTSSLGTMFSILWKLLLVPIETIKTVLQVDGFPGFQKLMKEAFSGNLLRLYCGSTATILSTLLSHYPWFYVHNLLEQRMKKWEGPMQSIARSALIGFLASIVSDCVSNVVRVIKTLKQTLGNDKAAFTNVVNELVREQGIWGFLGRGLATRIIANGLQSIVFVIVWKLIPLYISRRSKDEVEINSKGRENNDENVMPA